MAFNLHVITSKMNNNKHIASSSYTVTLDEFDFIIVQLKKDHIIDLKAAEELANAVLEVAGDKSRPLLCDLRQTLKQVTPDAGNYFAGNQALRKIRLALAFVIHKDEEKDIADSIIPLYEQVSPSKVFMSEERAKMWLFEEQLRYNGQNNDEKHDFGDVDKNPTGVDVKLDK